MLPHSVHKEKEIETYNSLNPAAFELLTYRNRLLTCGTVSLFTLLTAELNLICCSLGSLGRERRRLEENPLVNNASTVGEGSPALGILNLSRTAAGEFPPLTSYSTFLPIGYQHTFTSQPSALSGTSPLLCAD